MEAAVSISGQPDCYWGPASGGRGDARIGKTAAGMASPIRWMRSARKMAAQSGRASGKTAAAADANQVNKLGGRHSPAGTSPPARPRRKPRITAACGCIAQAAADDPIGRRKGGDDGNSDG
jgi:hypothetical protein